MSDLLGTNVSEELAIKVAELESLKKSYEDFIESSGSLEKELEDALKDSEDKCIELSKKKAIAEEKFSQLQDKYSTSGAQLINCQKEVSNLTEKLMQAESKKIELERIVDELQEMVRILETTETDLTHKVQIAEEDIIFLHTDLEEAKAASNDNEHRLKAELTELQAELARFEANGSHPVDGIEGAIKGAHETAIDDEEKQRQLELIDELEIEVEDLTERLTLSEQQNQQLNEEVSRLADELIQVHESKTAKSEVVPVSSDVESAHFEELAQLKSKLESTDLQLKAVSSSLEETKDEVSDLSNQLEQQIEKYIQLKLEYDDTMIALNSAKMNEKIANDALLLANENRNNSNSERVQNLEIELRLRDEAIQALHEKVADLEARIQEAKESETPVALPIAVQDPMMPITSDAPTSVIKVLPTNTLTSEDGHSEWIEERESLLREVEYLRNAINTTLVKSQASPRHSPVKTSSQCLMAMPDSEELAIPAIHILDTEEVSKRALDSVIGSGDLEKLKSMLLSKSTQLDATRKSNAKLLQKLQAARGNIQVCCRPRPPSASELARSNQGMQMSVDVIDDNEIACLDKRSESWKSFLFDRVWRMDSSQQDVFADVEPLVLSVIEGYNTCLFAYGQTGSGLSSS